MYGQQSLMPLIKAVTWGFGGGQLIEAALAVLVRRLRGARPLPALRPAALPRPPARPCPPGRRAVARLTGQPCPAAVPWVPSSASFRCRIRGPVHAVHAGAGQQPGPPPPVAIATAIEGGQLIAVRASACAEAADAAVLTPPAARAGGPA